MKTHTATFTALATIGLLALAACEDQGPLERAGEEVDEAIEDVSNGGETLGNRADDAIDTVRDEIEDAANAVEERVD